MSTAGCVDVATLAEDISNVVHVPPQMKHFDFQSDQETYLKKMRNGEKERRIREQKRALRIKANSGSDEYNRIQHIFLNPPKDSKQYRFGDMGTVRAENTPRFQFRDKEYDESFWPSGDNGTRQDVFGTVFGATLRSNHQSRMSRQGRQGISDKSDVSMNGIPDAGVLKGNLSGPFHPIYKDDNARDMYIPETKPSITIGKPPKNRTNEQLEHFMDRKAHGDRAPKIEYFGEQQPSRTKVLSDPLSRPMKDPSFIMNVRETPVPIERQDVINQISKHKTFMSAGDRSAPKYDEVDQFRVRRPLDHGKKKHSGPIYSMLPNTFSGRDSAVFDLRMAPLNSSKMQKPSVSPSIVLPQKVFLS